MASASRWTVLHELWVAAHRAERLVARELAGVGVDGTEFLLLGLLARERSATTTQLATEMGVPFMTMSSALQRLESRGEVARRSNPDDARSHVFELTREGRARARAAAPPLERALERLAGELDLDLGELETLLRQLDSALRRTMASITIS